MNFKRDSLKICLFGALLCLAECSVAEPITLKSYDLEPNYAKFSIPPSVTSGELIYAYDNTKITGAGIPWPWNNVLIDRKFPASEKDNLLKGSEVFRQRGDFVYNPQWLDSQRVLIEVGNPISSYGTYDLGLWNTATTSVETLAQNLSWKQVWPSISGRYVAFIEGGGEVPSGVGTPASFCTLNLQTKEKKVWPGFPAGIGNFWTPDDKILFTVVSETKAGEATPSPQLQSSTIEQGNVVDESVSKLKDNAFDATTSFDGKWLTYFTIPSPSDDAKAVTPDPTLPKPPITPDLMVARADGENPRKIPVSSSGSISIVWQPDSSGFILCQRRNVGRTQNKRVVEVTFSQVKIDEMEVKKLGAIRYVVSDGFETSTDDLLWRPLKVSKDNRFLLFELRQFGGAVPQGLSLQAFEIATGKIQIWAHVGSVRGLDWRED